MITFLFLWVVCVQPGVEEMRCAPCVCVCNSGGATIRMEGGLQIWGWVEPPPQRVTLTRFVGAYMTTFQHCFAGPNMKVRDLEPECGLFDKEPALPGRTDGGGDGDVDLRDFAWIQNWLGAGRH